MRYISANLPLLRENEIVASTTPKRQLLCFTKHSVFGVKQNFRVILSISESPTMSMSIVIEGQIMRNVLLQKTISNQTIVKNTSKIKIYRLIARAGGLKNNVGANNPLHRIHSLPLQKAQSGRSSLAKHGGSFFSTMHLIVG